MLWSGDETAEVDGVRRDLARTTLADLRLMVDRLEADDLVLLLAGLQAVVDVFDDDEWGSLVDL